jgi:hypothetical protein
MRGEGLEKNGKKIIGRGMDKVLKRKGSSTVTKRLFKACQKNLKLIIKDKKRNFDLYVHINYRNPFRSNMQIIIMY